MAARSARLPSPVRWQAGATARRARYSAGAAGACQPMAAAAASSR